MLAYHYLTAGHEDAAVTQLERIGALKPKDDLSRDLLLSLNPEANVPKPKLIEPPKQPSPIYMLGDTHGAEPLKFTN